MAISTVLTMISDMHSVSHCIKMIYNIVIIIKLGESIVINISNLLKRHGEVTTMTHTTGPNWASVMTCHVKKCHDMTWLIPLDQTGQVSWHVMSRNVMTWHTTGPNWARRYKGWEKFWMTHIDEKPGTDILVPVHVGHFVPKSKLSLFRIYYF